MRLLFSVLLLALVAVLAACAGDDDDRSDTVDTDDQTEMVQGTDDDQAARMDDDAESDDHTSMPMELDDEAFLSAMIEHHEGAVEMAEIALERAEREDLRQMAQEIIDTQEAEIDQMEAWLDEWYDGNHGDHGVSHEDMGMDMDLGEFRVAEPFDLAFIDAMIEHHDGAIEMARAVLISTDREELREMAHEIIEAQEAEIELMQQWRQEWFEY